MEWSRSVGPDTRPFPAILKQKAQNSYLAQNLSTFLFLSDGNEMVAMQKYSMINFFL